ncbi:MAG: hypothetical protein ACR2OR_02465 [Hyphomicrobiales bacterium]
MLNGRLVRTFILSGAAVAALAAHARAGDLDDLKSQIEALQSRVTELEDQGTAPPQPLKPVSIFTGQGALADWNVDRKQEGAMPSDRGYTFLISPSADVPAPITQVSVSGYVKGDFIFDFDQESLGPTFTSGIGIDYRLQKDQGFQTTAQQTRFRIRSSTNTAIGDIRTLIEGDFYNAGRGFRLRHAWGEWDMTPNWTLGIGRYWRLGYDVFTGVPLVDFGGSVGSPGASRREQVRLQYQDGPLLFAFGIQNPSNSQGGYRQVALCTLTVTGFSTCFAGETLGTAYSVPNTPNLPAFGGHMMYHAEFGHQFFIGGEISQHNVDRTAAKDIPEDGFGDEPGPFKDPGLWNNKNKVGWVVSAGANINLDDYATLTGNVSFSEGLVTRIVGAGSDIWRFESEPTDDDIRNSLQAGRGWGGYVGLSFDINNETSFNTQFGFVDPSDRNMTGGNITWSHMYTAHANIIWQPLRQMRMGWEIMYAQKTNGKNFVDGYAQPELGGCNEELEDGAIIVKPTSICRKRKEYALRAQFAAWLFF